MSFIGDLRTADNMDAALLKQAPKVMQYLKEKNYQNVGIVKFRVQKGKEQ